ncbi:MAG: glycosyltransferase [bacterium]|nr:glycosyltransferase [bacterium]
MKASVIVPVKNDSRIDQCIEALLNQEFSDDYEVIIVENGPEQLLKDVVKSYPVTYAYEPILGSYRARNTGIKLVNNDIVAFTDADCLVEKQWLEQLIAGFTEDSIGAVSGKNLNKKENNPVVLCQRNISIGEGVQYLSHIYPAPFAPTCNVAYRLSVLKELNGFDEEFKSGGDVDIAWRMSMLGYSMGYAPQAIVYFGCRTTVKAYYKQYFVYGKWHALLFKKYRKYTGKRMVINSYSIKLVAKSIFGLLKGIFLFKGKFFVLSHWLGLAEGVALINGGIAGSIKYHVLFTT